MLPSSDPARDTASVLRRIGFLVLMIALPVSAVARNGTVVAFVIGTVLLLVAAALDGPAPRKRDEPVASLTATAAAAAAGMAAVWAVVSAIWSPLPVLRPALALGAILALGGASYAALPERMRSANLYPAPIGAGALAVVSAVLLLGVWGEPGAERARLLERSLSVLVLFAWPAIAWLRSRRRDGEAVALAVGAALVAGFGPDLVPAVAFAAGAVAFLAVQLRAGNASLIGHALGLLLLLAPVLLATDLSGTAGDLGAWRRALLDEPARLLTGHGLGAVRTRLDLPGFAGSAILAVWYELGIVGTLALAVALASGLAATGAAGGPIGPGQAATVVTACVLTGSGNGGGALWWPVALATAALTLGAVRRGQFRTKRPRARLASGKAVAG